MTDEKKDSEIFDRHTIKLGDKLRVSVGSINLNPSSSISLQVMGADGKYVDINSETCGFCGFKASKISDILEIKICSHCLYEFMEKISEDFGEEFKTFHMEKNIQKE